MSHDYTEKNTFFIFINLMSVIENAHKKYTNGYLFVDRLLFTINMYTNIYN